MFCDRKSKEFSPEIWFMNDWWSFESFFFIFPRQLNFVFAGFALWAHLQTVYQSSLMIGWDSLMSHLLSMLFYFFLMLKFAPGHDSDSSLHFCLLVHLKPNLRCILNSFRFMQVFFVLFSCLINLKCLLNSLQTRKSLYFYRSRRKHLVSTFSCLNFYFIILPSVEQLKRFVSERLRTFEICFIKHLFESEEEITSKHLRHFNMCVIFIIWWRRRRKEEQQTRKARGKCNERVSGEERSELAHRTQHVALWKCEEE